MLKKAECLGGKLCCVRVRQAVVQCGPSLAQWRGHRRARGGTGLVWLRKVSLPWTVQKGQLGYDETVSWVFESNNPQL